MDHGQPCWLLGTNPYHTSATFPRAWAGDCEGGIAFGLTSDAEVAHTAGGYSQSDLNARQSQRCGPYCGDYCHRGPILQGMHRIKLAMHRNAQTNAIARRQSSIGSLTGRARKGMVKLICQSFGLTPSVCREPAGDVPTSGEENVFRLLGECDRCLRNNEVSQHTEALMDTSNCAAQERGGGNTCSRASDPAYGQALGTNGVNRHCTKHAFSIAEQYDKR